ncbi:MAG: alpha/beta fold hydrolase [Actinomycetes bacterium]
MVSHDGTTIALDRAQLRPPGPRRQRRHRAVCGRPRDEDLEAVIDAAGGSASLFGNSGGGILALEAAARGLAVTRIAVWEPPLHHRRQPPPGPRGLPAAARRPAGRRPPGRHGRAVPDPGGGIPATFVASICQSPFWASQEAVAHALVYDADIVGDFSLPAARLATVKAPPWSSGARPRG